MSGLPPLRARQPGVCARYASSNLPISLRSAAGPQSCPAHGDPTTLPHQCQPVQVGTPNRCTPSCTRIDCGNGPGRSRRPRPAASSRRATRSRGSRGGRPPRDPPLASPAPHLRRALGRLPPAGPDRDVRDLLEPRGDAGRLRARPRGRGLDLPELPRVRDRAAARDARQHRPPLVARPSRRLVEPCGLPGRLDLRADRHAGPARGRPRLGREAEGERRPSRSPTSGTARRARAPSTRARTSLR